MGHAKTAENEGDHSVQIAISSRHGSLSPDQEQYVRDKVAKLTKLFDRLSSITVTVNYEASIPNVEILANAEHKHDFVSHDQNANVFAAVDAALHKMEVQLRRYKERLQDKRGTTPMGGSTAPVRSAEGEESE
jgi:putative sigma-54 modulation protein